MKSVQLFNEFTLHVLNKLYGSFPIPIKLEEDQILGTVNDYPEQPFKSYMGVPGTGVYVGPDLEWVFDKEQRLQKWEKFDWSSCLAEAEASLGWKLSEEEKETLFTQGTRPYTHEEEQALARWKEEVAIYRENDEQRQRKKDIFIATIQFLVKEGYIRFMDLPGYVDKQLQPNDILIERALKQLRFTLTNRGFVQLNKKLASGKLSSDLSVYEGIASYFAGKTVDAFTGAGANALMSSLFGG